MFYRSYRICYTLCHHTDPVFAEFSVYTHFQCQTVKEVFARQLMQISGISGDKAAAILEHYSTVSRYEQYKPMKAFHCLILYCQYDITALLPFHSLLNAYNQCSTDTEREKLLSSIKYGRLKRFVFCISSSVFISLYICCL